MPAQFREPYKRRLVAQAFVLEFAERFGEVHVVRRGIEHPPIRESARHTVGQVLRNRGLSRFPSPCKSLIGQVHTFTKYLSTEAQRQVRVRKEVFLTGRRTLPWRIVLNSTNDVFIVRFLPKCSQ